MPVTFRALLPLGAAFSVRLLVFPKLDLVPGWLGGLVAVGIILAVIVFHDDMLDWVRGPDDDE